MTKKKVLILSPFMGVNDMFKVYNFRVFSESEWDLVDQKEFPDLICFTGGSDVDPSYYGETKLIQTVSNKHRDVKEKFIFDSYKNIPKVGICRGGQFLNVMSGGSMWQDVNHHTSPHKMINLLKSNNIDEEEIYVSSTHHQMMIPGPGGIEIAIAYDPEKKKGLSDRYLSSRKRDNPRWDTEVVYYENTKSLCFQPHPEFNGTPYKGMTDYFFKLLNHFFF